MGVVVRHGRPAAVPGSDDLESPMRERGDGAGGAAVGDGGGAVQNHEGRRIVADRFRTVPGEDGEGDQDDHPADARGTPQGYPW